MAEDGAPLSGPQKRFLDAMGRETRARLAADGVRRVWRKGETIFAQDEPGDSLLVVETGRADVERVTAQGRRVVLGHLGPGDLAGEMAVLDGAPRSASLVAATPVTGVLLSRAQVERFLLANPDVMLGIIAELARKLRIANLLAEDRAVESGDARLSRCLLRLARRWGDEAADGGGVRLRGDFSQGALGALADLSRENVNRRLRAWERSGWIGRLQGRLAILDQAALERLAEAAEDAARDV